MKRIVLFAIVVWGIFACSESFISDERKPTAAATKVVQFFENPSKLDQYWYQGKAEITSYELSQNRYQDVHPGQAVMVFVTEDFLLDKQVKNESYQSDNSTNVLKNNMIRTFPTGIYDYSMMTSVFTPANVSAHPQTLKISTSVQEWCGQAYMQVNKKPSGYQFQLHSYFEKEADQEALVPNAILEDELYNRIRINPEGLPTGKHKVYPSTMVVRLKHLPFQALEADLSIGDYGGDEFEGETLKQYSVHFPTLKRTLEIVFEQKAPHEIVGWVDAYPSAFDQTIRKTIAKRKKTIMVPYWQQNSLEDMALRADLALD